MPGMGRALQANNPVILSAFRTALFHQFLFILLVLFVGAVGWNVVRTVQYRRAVAAGTTTGDTGAAVPLGPEPLARRVLRIGFGVLWLFDGLLQVQPNMPLGLTGNVLQPAAHGSPSWVQHVVNAGVGIWTRHPVQAAASAVWIQVGIGVLLLVAPRGRWSRFAGLASVGWGLVVWVFGEAFGGLFAPGYTLLFGAPGAVLFYVVAGALVALPDRAWATRKLGRSLLAGLGGFFIAMAVLQAWPGRGFWQGTSHGRSGTLTSMVSQMASTSQPHAISATVAAFGRFDGAHGWGVNLFVVVALAVIGVLLVRGRPTEVRVALVAAAVLGLSDWLLVEDVGFLGGTGTDPNSMLPLLLLLFGGYLALVRLPVPAEAPAAAAAPVATAAGSWWERATPGYLARWIGALCAFAVVLVGAAPTAAASINPNADPIIAEANDGTPNVLNAPAPPFSLVDQRGEPVSLATLHGKIVALTFLDPVCTTDCPVIAQEFREADSMLGSQRSRVDFVAVVANPLYRSVPVVNAFDRQESLNHIPNWLFLTGSLPELTHVWDSYGIQTQVEPAGAMVAHGELAYLIDANGHTRVVLNTAPTPGAAGNSSFTVLLTTQLEHLLAS